MVEASHPAAIRPTRPLFETSGTPGRTIPRMFGRATATGLGLTTSRRRAAAVALTVASWLLGSLLGHTGLEQHGGVEGPTRVYVAQDVGQPNACVEPSRPVDVPACPACILQLHSVGTATASSLAAVGLVALGAAPVDGVASIALASPRLEPSRGPPLA
jgi:hypothetical protein